MTEEQQEELEGHVLSLKYFWEEKGDMERYCYFEEIKSLIEEHYPEILKAWYDYKLSKKILNNIVNGF